MGIKERRTKIILALFVLSDVNFSYVPFDQRLQTIFDLSFNQKTRGTISALIKEGIIEKNEATLTVPTPPPQPPAIEPTAAPGATPEAALPTSVGTPIAPMPQLADPAAKLNSSQYRLTQKGFYALCLEFPFFRYLRDKWDGKWRILSYEIPEKRRELRDRLRREVTGWGLGPWHRSFWLTPHPIIENLRQLVSEREEEKYIQAFESEHVFGNRDILIEKVWQKSALDKKYRDVFKKWHDILSKEGDKATKFRAVISEYVEILRQDPGLPTDLVGSAWIGFEAYNIFKEIRGILLS